MRMPRDSYLRDNLLLREWRFVRAGRSTSLATTALAWGLVVLAATGSALAQPPPPAGLPPHFPPHPPGHELEWEEELEDEPADASAQPGAAKPNGEVGPAPLAGPESLPPELLEGMDTPAAEGKNGPQGRGHGRRLGNRDFLRKLWQGLSSEERDRFMQNKERWQSLPPADRRELLARHFHMSRKADKEIAEIIRQSGAQFTPERRDAFKQRYIEERRRLEHELISEMIRMREEQLPRMLDGLKGEFPELGETQFTGIGNPEKSWPHMKKPQGGPEDRERFRDKMRERREKGSAEAAPPPGRGPGWEPAGEPQPIGPREGAPEPAPPAQLQPSAP